MIETTFMHLDEAAAALKIDVRTLVIAAAERRVRLYGFSADIRETVTFYKRADGKFDHSGGRRFVEYIPLDFTYIFKLQANGETGPIHLAYGLRDLDGNEVELLEDLKENPIPSIPLSRVFALRQSVREIAGGAATPPVDQPNAVSASFFSDELLLMIQAAHAYWKNASKNDPGTQHKNDEVAAWLEQRGMTKSKAISAASLIRPSWAHNGRKPES